MLLFSVVVLFQDFKSLQTFTETSKEKYMKLRLLVPHYKPVGGGTAQLALSAKTTLTMKTKVLQRHTEI